MDPTAATQPMLHEFVGRILAAESRQDAQPEPEKLAMLRVHDKLRIALCLFTGVDGCHALLNRALALAQSECPALSSVRLNEANTLLGLESLLNAESPAAGAGALILVHIISLLISFIGEPLTLNLIHQIWPTAGNLSQSPTQS